MAFTDPDRAVDVTKTFNRKIDALRCHKSQVGDGAALAAASARGSSPRGRAAGLPPRVVPAEMFKVIDTR